MVAALSVWLILPPNEKGGVPGAADTALNCQLPATFGAGGVAGGGGAVPEDVEVETAGVDPGTPPHPQRRTVAVRAKMAAEPFIELLLQAISGPFLPRHWMEMYGDYSRTVW